MTTRINAMASYLSVPYNVNAGVYSTTDSAGRRVSFNRRAKMEAFIREEYFGSNESGLSEARANPAVRLSTKDPAEMTAGEIRKEYEKLGAMASALTQESIAMGRGHWRYTETAVAAQAGDDHAQKQMVVNDRQQALHRETELREGPGRSPDRLKAGKRSYRANPANPAVTLNSPVVAEGVRQFTKKHWGIKPTKVLKHDDPDLPPVLTQMGRLLELKIEDRGKEIVLDFAKYRPYCQLAFTLDKAQRLYNLLTPAAEADCARRLLVKGAPFYSLSDLARQYAPGRQNRYPYPDVEVQCLGTITEVSYWSDKKEDKSSEGQGGPATYVHAVAEENSKHPLLGIDRAGRLFWVGGDYRLLDGGIAN